MAEGRVRERLTVAHDVESRKCMMVDSRARVSANMLADLWKCTVG